MTMTQADWQALAAAGAAGGTPYLEQLNAEQQQVNAQKQQMLAGIPDSGAGSFQTGGLSATSTASTIGQDTINLIQNQFPDIAWMLAIPDLAPSIIEWSQKGYTSTQADAAFQDTTWYQTHGDTVRSWIAEVNEDPAKAQSDLAAQESAIGATLNNLGLGYTASQLTMFATQSLAMGWTDQQIKDQVGLYTQGNGPGAWQFTYGGQVGDSTSTGTLLATEQSVQAEAAKFLVPVSDSTTSTFAMKLASGQMDNSAVTAYFQAQAESLYPSIKGAIAQGIDPATYVTPYKEVAAQLLGVDPNSIDMTQAKYSRALTAPGPGGVPTAMSLYDFQQMLMQDPQYGYKNSVNAKDRASSIAQGLGEMFGATPAGPAGSTAFSAAGAPRMPGVPIT